MYTAASRRASRARRTRRAIPCIAVTITLGNLAERWVAQRTDPSVPPCAVAAAYRPMPAPADDLAVERTSSATNQVVLPPTPQAPPAGSGATSSTSVTSR
jgi:hypothetical protein